MTVLVIVLVLAAVGAAVWRWRPNTPPAPAEDEATVLRRCRQQAQMQNFWAYDGTEQRDVEEVAAALYRKRGKKKR